MEKCVNAEVKKNVINYILDYGMSLSMSLVVCNVILKEVINNPEFNKEEEIQKSKVFNSYDSLIAYNKKVRTELSVAIANLQFSRLVSVIASDDAMEEEFKDFFAALDTREDLSEYYCEEFKNHDKQESAI